MKIKWITSNSTKITLIMLNIVQYRIFINWVTLKLAKVGFVDHHVPGAEHLWRPHCRTACYAALLPRRGRILRRTLSVRPSRYRYQWRQRLVNIGGDELFLPFPSPSRPLSPLPSPPFPPLPSLPFRSPSRPLRPLPSPPFPSLPP